MTHYHSDHIAALAEGLLDRLSSMDIEAVVAAPSSDAPAIRDPLLRVTLTFGYPLDPSSEVLPFRAPPVRVDVELTAPSKLGPLEVVPLPGHTPSQVGVIAPDGTLYAADALFGPKVLENYGVPYHLDPCRALESLDTQEKLLPQITKLQPSHGPPVSAEEAARLVEANRKAIQTLLDFVIEETARRPSTSSELAARASQVLGAPGEPGMLMLIETTVRGALSCLHSRGVLHPRPLDGALFWESSREGP